MVLNFIRGFCMAPADSVPGVSGGTIVFLLGSCDRFIGSLDAPMSGNMQQKKETVIFLLKLGIGWIVGFLMVVSVFASIFHTQIYAISSLFVGFILFAIPTVIWEEKENVRLNVPSMIVLFVGIAVAVLITYCNPVAGGGSSVNLAKLDIGLIVYVFISAMFATSAMVLPGISGSTLLLVFGLYAPIISAIKALMGSDLSYVLILLVFELGVITGVITVVWLIKFALEKHRNIMVFLIIGIILGSFYVIIMGPQILETPQTPLSLETFEIFWFTIGGAIILGLQKMKDISEKQAYTGRQLLFFLYFVSVFSK